MQAHEPAGDLASDLAAQPKAGTDPDPDPEAAASFAAAVERAPLRAMPAASPAAASSHAAGVRPAMAGLGASLIREVANAGLGRDDVLAFWFGESDAPTPEVIRAAAADSLARGETFYSHNLGRPELREALRAYVGSLHGDPGADRIAVTNSGVTALMVAAQWLISPGDEVVVVTPVWPNLPAQPAILGAQVKRVALRPDADGRWGLDVAALVDSITPRTRMLLVNAPNNPTGWTLTRAEQQALLDHCRATGTWIVADEVYERAWFGDGPAAPSFLDLATPEDRLIVIGSFSKSFLMTGWRLGWLVLPRGVIASFGTLIEFNSSCAPVFVQRAGLAALAHAPAIVPAVRAQLQAGRDALLAALQAQPALRGRLRLAAPQAAMYAFLRVEGTDDSLALAQRLVADHGLGLAPGAAFGPEGEGWLRWCFASQDTRRIEQGVARLAQALKA